MESQNYKHSAWHSFASFGAMFCRAFGAITLSLFAQSTSFASPEIIGTSAQLQAIKLMTDGRLPNEWAGAVRNCETQGGGSTRSEARADCVIEQLYQLSGQTPEEAEDSARISFEAFEKTGYVLSLTQGANPENVSQLWAYRDLKEMEKALSLLPPTLRAMPGVIGFQRVARGYMIPGYPGAAGVARAPIQLRSDSFGGDETAVIAIHELAHHYDRIYGQKGFDKLTRWDDGYYVENGKTIRGTTIYKHVIPGAVHVTPYASSGPTEDFAESVAYSIVKPELAREKIPAKLEFLRRLFGF